MCYKVKTKQQKKNAKIQFETGRFYLCQKTCKLVESRKAQKSTTPKAVCYLAEHWDPPVGLALHPRPDELPCDWENEVDPCPSLCAGDKEAPGFRLAGTVRLSNGKELPVQTGECATREEIDFCAAEWNATFQPDPACMTEDGFRWRNCKMFF